MYNSRKDISYTCLFSTPTASILAHLLMKEKRKYVRAQ
jgi:hypothetical protein